MPNGSINDRLERVPAAIDAARDEKKEFRTISSPSSWVNSPNSERSNDTLNLDPPTGSPNGGRRSRGECLSALRTDHG